MKKKIGLVIQGPITTIHNKTKKYYEDAFYNIINYYPFDGTREEILDWYSNTTPLEVAILQSHWPGSVGHIKLDTSEYVSFYAGPQSIAEFSNTGNYRRSETGLKIDPEKGNTVEFWMKKQSFDASEEVLFHVGSYPGKVPANKSAVFKLVLKNDSGSPFFLYVL